MIIKSIKINNIASFVNFKTTVELKKRTLIYGTNGSGKSTISTLLQLIDNYYKSNKTQDSFKLIKQYIDSKSSKECLGKDSEFTVYFNSKIFSLNYSNQNNILNITNDNWFPIRVFNSEYTNKTIGSSVEMNLVDNDLIIGEPNKKLDEATRKRNGLIKKQEEFEKKIDDSIQTSKQQYKDLTNSNADITNIISEKELLSKENTYSDIIDAKDNRKKLGFEKPVDNLQFISHRRFEGIVPIDNFQPLFLEKIVKPTLDEDQENLLINFTNFYREGMKVSNQMNEDKCPFCFQKWDSPGIKLKKYKNFLESDYNNQRDIISSLKKNIEQFIDEISRVNLFIDNNMVMITNEGNKYEIKTEKFKSITLNKSLQDSLLDRVNHKSSNMEESIDIKQSLETLFNYYTSEIQIRNNIIQRIKDYISQIRSKRLQANKEVSKQIMSELWVKSTNDRETLKETVKDVQLLEKEIEEIENLEIDQETISSIFNNLISFLGLSEYKINNDKKLILSLNRDYDITKEGGRISSAQKKILSLCYFFAEIISELKTENDLNKYMLVFDDPVDSADYNYFHSITALLENVEVILQKILKKNNLKIGQIIVLTHNSLLHDRLSQNFEINKTIKKIENKSTMTSSEKTVNNYKTYLEYIIRYYENPRTTKKDMIFIGNIIRRVLEILSNFNNLDNNSFDKYIIGIGKPKLALISNHLSHEFFTKVLNPLTSELELKEACKELLDVIKESHPEQYKFIEENMLKINEVIV